MTPVPSALGKYKVNFTDLSVEGAGVTVAEGVGVVVAVWGAVVSPDDLTVVVLLGLHPVMKIPTSSREARVEK